MYTYIYMCVYVGMLPHDSRPFGLRLHVLSHEDRAGLARAPLHFEGRADDGDADLGLVYVRHGIGIGLPQPISRRFEGVSEASRPFRGSEAPARTC